MSFLLKTVLKIEILGTHVQYMVVYKDARLQLAVQRRIKGMKYECHSKHPVHKFYKVNYISFYGIPFG
jgi:hypothetical protein